MPNLANYAPVEEVPVAPVYTEPVPVEPVYTEPAPAPVESAPPPADGGGVNIATLGGEQAPQDYTAAPAAPPDEFIPGSTYRPMSIEEEKTQLQEAPAPIPNSTVNEVPVESAAPTDKWSGVGDVVRVAGDAIGRHSPMDLATTALDALGMPQQQAENQVAQRVKDEALTGNPDATISAGFGLQDLIDHPENLNPAFHIGNALANWEAPDWVPVVAKDSMSEYYNDPVEGAARQAAATEREKTEGVAAWYDNWEDSQDLTLDTGGVPGLLRGMAYGTVTDPTLYASLGLGAATKVGITAAEGAGQIGTARGLQAINKAGQIALDPLFEGGGSLVSKIPGGIGKLLSPSEKTSAGIASDQVEEAVGTAAQSIQSTVPSGANSPNLYLPPEPVIHGPEAPSGYPTGDMQGTGGIIQYPTPVTPQPLQGPWQGEIIQGPTQRELTNARAATPTPEAHTPAIPTNESARKLETVPNPTNPSRTVIQYTDGKAPTTSELEAAMRAMNDIHPNEFVPAQYGWDESQNALMRGAMTQQKFMLNNVPSSRADGIRQQAAAMKVPVDDARIAGGRRFITLQTNRIRTFGQLEVQKQLDGMQRQVNMQLSSGVPWDRVNRDMANAFQSLQESADGAKFGKSFQLNIGGKVYRHLAGGGEMLTPRSFGTMEYRTPYPNTLKDQGAFGIIEGFAPATDPGNAIKNFFFGLGARRSATMPDYMDRLVTMMQDPEGLIFQGHSRARRDELVSQKIASGEWTPQRANQIDSYFQARELLAKQLGLKRQRGKNLEMYAPENRANIDYVTIKEEHGRWTKGFYDQADLVNPGEVLDEAKMADDLVALESLKTPAVDATATKPKGTPFKPEGNPWEPIKTPREKIVTGSPTDPWKDARVTADRYPHLFATMNTTSTANGNGDLLAAAARNRKVKGTRMEAMGKNEFIPDSEYEGSGLAAGMQLILNHVDDKFPIVINGEKARMYTYIRHTMDEVAELKNVVARSDPNNPKEARAIAEIRKKYTDDAGDLDLTDLTPDEIREITTVHVTRIWAEQHVPKDAPNRMGLIGDAGKLAKSVVDFRRGVGLTNYVAAPRQVLNQYFGNMFGLFMGKPSAVLSMLNMKELYRHFQQIQGVKGAPNTQIQKIMKGYGADAPNTMLAGADRTLIGHETNVSGFAGKLRDWVAPKHLRSLVASPDELAKGAVAGSTFRKNIRREVDALPANSKLTAARMAQKRQGLEVVAARIDTKLPAALEKYKTPDFNRPQFTGEQLELEIKDIFKEDVKRGVVNRESLGVYADRMKRDWNTVVNTEKQVAASEVKRVMFSWDNTRADDLIQNVFLYHYWSTRASVLYGKEFIKKPWLVNLYMDAAGQFQAEAEAGNYPDWMKGFSRILNSPHGVSLFFNPLDMVGTALYLNEAQMGNETGDNPDLTALGNLKGMIPFVWNPILELVLTYSGAFGDDASMPNNMTGMNRMTGLAADVVNWANYQGLLGPILKDSAGNPSPVAPRPFDDVILGVAGRFGMPVTPSLASFEKETVSYLQERLIDENGGEMDPAELNDMVDQIMTRAKSGDVDPMLYDSQADALANGMQGPEFEFLPEGLRPIVGAAIRYTSPVRMMAKSEFGFKTQYPGSEAVLGGDPSYVNSAAEAGGDTFDIKGTRRSPFQTQRSRAMDVAYQDYYDGGNPQLAELQDTFYDIGGNRIGQPVVVGGIEHSVSEINAMSEGDRYDLAEGWLLEQGYTKSDMSEMDAHREEIIANNPDIGGYIAFGDYVDNYPGGKEAFVDEAIRTSPSYAEYMAGQGVPGSPEYYEYADSKDAFWALNGVKSSVYGIDNPAEQGYIPGLPQGTNFNVKYESDKKVEEALDGGENSFTKFVGDVQTDVNNIYYAQDWLDTNYPGVVANGNVPYDIYQEMKAAGVAAPSIKDSGIAYEYYDWFALNASAADVSVEAFLDQRPSTGGGSDWKDQPAPTASQIADQRGIATSTPSQVSLADLKSYGVPSLLVEGSPVYSGPGYGNGQTNSLPPQFPLKEIYRSQDGWSQVYIPGMAGAQPTTGWVPTEYLAAQA